MKREVGRMARGGRKLDRGWSRPQVGVHLQARDVGGVVGAAASGAEDHRRVHAGLRVPAILRHESLIRLKHSARV